MYCQYISLGAKYIYIYIYRYTDTQIQRLQSFLKLLSIAYRADRYKTGHITLNDVPLYTLLRKLKKTCREKMVKFFPK